ncbi:hypothetical protein [Nostoc sp. TCL26-01]|uniref:hypothetical protein n=1 Tax=Nostoc sp. TCL26-01 TaxID=2576904 RepID=UPI0015C03116|nr:hypothetical protein [Nostoc sp. TCL26-01]QLE56646.1 hypothetical protein FD725_14725 [Nostoc sp. TCL26-01]
MRSLRQSDLTAEERQSILLKVSKDYMSGKMSRTQLQEAERKYGTDYGSVTLSLASQHHLLPRLWRFLISPLRSDRRKIK